MTNRSYTCSDGMTVKTKNAKKSWMGIHEIEQLHVTRKDLYWLEYYDDKRGLTAKKLDKIDAQAWLVNNKYESK